MAYVNYNQKDDMQDDTYGILSELIIDAIVQFRGKNARMLYNDIDAIYIIIWSRMSAEQQALFDKTLADLSTQLYDESSEVVNDPEELSAVFDDLRLLLKDITRELDAMKILFKTRVDPKTLIMGNNML